MENLLVIAGGLVAYLVVKQLRKPNATNITSDELKTMMTDKSKRNYVDVRTPQEYASNKIKGFKNIPLGDLQKRLKEIDQDKETVLICASGARSASAARILNKHGYTNLFNVKRGMMGYKG